MKQSLFFFLFIGLLLLDYMHLIALVLSSGGLRSLNLLNCSYFLGLAFYLKKGHVYLVTRSFLMHAWSRDKLFWMIYFIMDLFMHIPSKAWKIACRMYLTYGTIMDFNFSSIIIIYGLIESSMVMVQILALYWVLHPDQRISLLSFGVRYWWLPYQMICSSSQRATCTSFPVFGQYVHRNFL